MTRPALKYFGSKNRVAPKIIKYFPPHVCYVEPFGGGASILIEKTPSTHEVYNDLDSSVVNFFRVLREHPDELIRHIQLTPVSREEWKTSFTEVDEPIENARRFYVRLNQSRGSGLGRTSPGWRFVVGNSNEHVSSVTRQWAGTDHLWEIATRLMQVQIENDTAFNVIKRYASPKTLFYLDPPYVHETRNNTHLDAYAHEMSNDDHIALANLIKSSQGMFIVSGYQCDLYNELYKDWSVRTFESNNGISKTVQECLWLSPSALVGSQMTFDF